MKINNIYGNLMEGNSQLQRIPVVHLCYVGLPSGCCVKILTLFIFFTSFQFVHEGGGTGVSRPEYTEGINPQVQPVYQLPHLLVGQQNRDSRGAD